jgi:hypothetical protein
MTMTCFLVTDMMHLVKLINFRLPNCVEYEEKLDTEKYRSNLFYAFGGLSECPEMCSKFVRMAERAIATPEELPDDK